MPNTFGSFTTPGVLSFGRCASIYRLGVRIITAFALLAVNSPTVHAQDDSYLQRIGAPDFSVIDGVKDGYVNSANGNLHIEIPIASIPQRGGSKFTASLVYDSKIWNDYIFFGQNDGWYPYNVAGTLGGWRIVVSGQKYTNVCSPHDGSCFGVQYGFDEYYCSPDGVTTEVDDVYGPFTWNAPDGTSETFGIQTDQPADPNYSCNYGPVPNGTARIGPYSMVVTNYTDAVVYEANGTQVFPTVKDPNGNFFSLDGNGNVIDTLGKTPVLVSSSGNQMYLDVLNSSGGRSRFTVTTESISADTNFQFAQRTEYSGSINVIQSLTLPNGASYSFGYDSGTTPGHYGLLSSITFPTGGTDTYTYANFIDWLSGMDRWVSGRTSATGTWAYNPAVVQAYCYTCTPKAIQSMTLNKPLGARVVYTFSMGPSYLPEDTNEQYYDGPTLLQTKQITYNGNLRPVNITTILPSGGNNTQKTEYSWDTAMDYLATEVREWDWYAGTPPPSPSRTTDATYTYSNPTYLNLNIVDKPLLVTVKNSSGTVVAQTQFEYDNYTAGIVASGAVQHDSSFGTAYGTRGNATAISRWRNTDGAWLTTRNQYDDAGSVVQTTDPNGHNTNFSYADSWGNVACAPTGGVAAAFRTSATNALNQVSRSTFNSCTGTLASTTDANSQTTTFGYDSMGRPVSTNFPDGGHTTLTYNDTALPASVTTTEAVDSTKNLVQTAVYDGWARVSQTQLNSDPAGTDYTDTTYDALGRVASVSNPYRSTGDPTYGATTYAHDALDRTTRVTDADGSVINTTYSGNCTTVTDEAGKNRESCTDGLGRMTSVIENPGGLGYTTNYTYDALDNLISVQNGSRSRSFVHNSLSELTSATNPESGAISYAYDANGNVVSKTAPAPNQTGSATVTTTYSYDALNRLTQKSYSDGTPIVSFLYDGPTNGFNVPATNLIGRLAEEWTGTNCCPPTAEIFSYDPVGRVTLNTQYFPQVGFLPVNYTYDTAGDMTSYTNGAGVTFTQVFNAAAQLTQLASNLIDSQHPGTLATFNNYSPFGAMKGMAYGNGLTQTAAFNNRLQPCRGNVNSSGTILNACTDSIPSGSLLDFNYSWNAGTGDNGNLTGLTAAGQQTFNRSYTFDALNRLGSMADADSVASCLGLTWNYDAWGNRTAQTPTRGTCGRWSSAYTANNQIVGYSYDAAGNLLNDGMHAYTYDAENRITAVDGGATATYVYDAEGRRATKTTGGVVSDYVHDLSGRAVTIYGDGCNITCWARGYVYADGRLIAEYGDSTTYFVQTDHLGSTRLMTAMNQSVHDSMDYLPFGEQIAGDTGTTHKFTGKERDPESNLDNFGARYYSSSVGRFLSADDPFEDQHAGDPQSWNLYSYVRNNPLNNTDPDGRACVQGSDGKFHDDNSGGQSCADASQPQIVQVNAQAPPSDLLLAVALGTRIAEPGVNLAYNGLRTFGYVVAPPIMAAADCAAGASSCTKGNVAMAILPEISALRDGALVLKEGAAVGKAAEILQKGGGAAQAAKDFDSLQGAEKVYGGTRVKELADGTKAVLYESKGGPATIALQDAAGRTVTKIRY